MRKFPHTRLGKSALELHYGREANTKISNLLNIDSLKTIANNCFSAKPDTLQVYSFYGIGGASDQLPLKQKKGSKGVINYPFQLLEIKMNKSKIDSAYSDKLQTAISGTKHTVKITDNKYYIENTSVDQFLKLHMNRTTEGRDCGDRMAGSLNHP